MKKLKLFLMTVGISLGVATLNSCTKDACKDVNCGANGACTDGTCVCTAGYEGTNCEKEVREKIIGNFQVQETCSSTGAATYTVTVAKSSTDVLKVTCTKFGGYPSATGVLKLDGSTLSFVSVDGTTLTFSGFSGAVNASGSTITVNYAVSDGTASETCQGTWTKQ